MSVAQRVHREKNLLLVFITPDRVGEVLDDCVQNGDAITATQFEGRIVGYRLHSIDVVWKIEVVVPQVTRRNRFRILVEQFAKVSRVRDFRVGGHNIVQCAVTEDAVEVVAEFRPHRRGRRVHQQRPLGADNQVGRDMKVHRVVECRAFEATADPPHARGNLAWKLM